jgi:hypothetical protein
MKYDINQYGDIFWYDDARRFHRENGPAIIWSNGDIEYYQHGEFHREDGPAVMFDNGDNWYYQHGKLHRLDGPAIEGHKLKKWLINGINIKCSSNEEFLKIVRLKNLL